MPTTDQITDAVAAAAQIPINNGLIIIVLLTLGIFALGGVTIWRFAPILISLYKQQAETNSKLTQIVGQNSKQAELAMASVDSNTGEMVKQTAAINNQTSVIEGQGHDLRAYQTLVSDNLSAHTEQITTNTANIAELKTSVNSNTESIAALTEQIKALVDKLDDKAACAEAEERMRQFRDEIVELVTKQHDKRATSELAIVPNVLPDDPPAELPKAS